MTIKVRILKSNATDELEATLTQVRRLVHRDNLRDPWEPYDGVSCGEDAEDIRYEADTSF